MRTSGFDGRRAARAGAHTSSAATAVTAAAIVWRSGDRVQSLRGSPRGKARDELERARAAREVDRAAGGVEAAKRPSVEDHAADALAAGKPQADGELGRRGSRHVDRDANGGGAALEGVRERAEARRRVRDGDALPG